MQLIQINDNIKNEVDKLKAPVLGIDFGTTHSLIAYTDEHNITKIIKDKQNRELIPSIINFVNNDLDTEIIIGEGCFSLNKIYSIKRLIGKSFDDILQNKSLTLDNISIERDKNFDSRVKFTLNNKKFSVEELAAKIFLYLKNMAENHFKNLNVSDVVVSVPAYFDNIARGQIMLAAKHAGLNIIRLIAEPTAAAYAYKLNNQVNGSYLVYDLGGGTFDVSILNMRDGVLQVIATGGDNILGGDDIDQIIATYICNLLSIELSTNILLEVKKIKHFLSSNFIFKGMVANLNVEITRNELEKLIKPILEKTIKIAQNVHHDADNLKLDGLILAGGSTRIPLIKNMLQERFNTKILDEIDPDKVVVVGSSIQARNLSNNVSTLLLDVVPLSLGIELYGGLVEKIITHNTPIPYSISKEFTTWADDQTGMKFHIVQGEREMAKDCRSLAFFELKNIPKMKAGKPRINLTFAIDANGILSIIAQELSTSLIENLEIKPSFGLNSDIINECLEVDYKNAAKDHDEKLLTEAILSAENLIKNLSYAAMATPDILSKEEYEKIDESINLLRYAIKSRNRQKILSNREKLNMLAENFMRVHLNYGAKMHLTGKKISDIT